MKQLSISILVLVLSVSANAETVSLVCEHDAGTHIRNGELLDPDNYMAMFRLDIDTELMTAKASIGIWSQTIKFSGASASDEPIVFFTLKIDKDEHDFDVIQYALNRITGTLFATIKVFIDDTDGGTENYYVTAGQCVNANGKPLF